MNSRERVLTTFEHRQPDRVPIWCGASPEFWEKAGKRLQLEDEDLRIRFGDDFRRVFAGYAGPDFEPGHNGVTSTTVFGIERRGLGYGQPVTHPLAQAGLKQVHDYNWPDPQWMDVSDIRDQALAFGREYAILGGDWSPFWHDAIDLLGMEELCLRMYSQPRLIDAIMKHLVDYYFEVSRRIFDAAADAIDIFFIGNDFGSTTGPLLGPELFSRFVLPHLKRLIDLGHAYNLKVQLHCCGGFAELIPLLIDAALDALHAIQPCCRGMDLPALKKDFGDRIVFNGAIDSQHVLIEGNPQTVTQKTRQVLDIMKPGGGFIAGASHDAILEETPLENVLAMFDTIKKYGTYD